ncbi:MAG: DMT family transporter [Pirellulaceae bacterium]
MPYVLFLACSLVWSTSFILMKKAALGFTPLSIGAWRCVWGATILGVLSWQQGLLHMPSRRVWWPMAAVTLLGCAGPYVIQPWVVARQGSAFMALVVSFVPLATIVASVPLLGQWPTMRQTLGVCGALGCMALLMADGLERRAGWSVLTLAALVPCGYALANTVIRRWLQDLPALTLTFFLLTFSAALLLPLSQLQQPPSATGRVWWGAWLSVAALGLVGTGLATYWFNKLIRDHGPLFAGMTTNLVPLGAVLWGWLDRETVSGRQWLALAGIVMMVAWVQIGAARTVPRRGDSQ